MQGMILRSAFEIALGRAENMQNQKEAPIYGQKKIVRNPDNDDVYGGLPDDFFVDDSPTYYRGSRAETDDARRLEAQRRMENATPLWARQRREEMPEPTVVSSNGPYLIYEGPFLSHSGYSTMNRCVVSALIKAGVTVQTRIVPTTEKVSIETNAFFRELENVEVPDGTPHVFGMTVPSIIPNKNAILYTMMETSNAVHHKYAERLNLAKELWVPTEYSAQIMKRSGVRIPISVFPLGVDTSLFNRDAAPMSLGGIKEQFKFLSVFNWGYRKGYDILLRTFFRAFTSKDDTCLIICSQMQDSKDGKKAILKIIEEYRAEASADNPDPANVYLIYGDIPESDMPSLYTACNAFVLLSRGEGMGLPYLEAGACGLPVLGTFCTAMTTFLDESNSYLVHPDGFRKMHINDPTSSNLVKLCYFYENQDFPVFNRQAHETITSLMREMRYNEDESKEKAAALQQLVHRRYNWDVTAENIKASLSNRK